MKERTPIISAHMFSSLYLTLTLTFSDIILIKFNTLFNLIEIVMLSLNEHFRVSRRPTGDNQDERLID